MDRLKKSIKRFMSRFCLPLVIGLALVQPSYAQTDYLLAKILAETQAILSAVNKIPAYILSITIMANSWNDTQSNNAIGDRQQNIAALANTDISALQSQLDLSTSLTKNFLTTGGATAPSNAYELGYPVMFNQPIAGLPKNALGINTNSIAQAQQNYVKYLSGTDIYFQQVQPGWDDTTKKQYQGIYNTVAAISSFNAYLLSNLYANQSKQNTRKAMIAQATNSNWFTTVATESLGLVLRQTLMYTSQVYVTLDRIASAQQDQLAAQAMTNSLLVIYANYAVAQQLVTVSVAKQQQKQAQQQ